MTKKKWKLVGRPEPKGSGQRFFIADEGVWDHKVPEHRADRDRAIREGGVHLYVADNSGVNPDDTDDGPLVLDRDFPIKVGHWCGRIGAEATVLVKRDGLRNSRCGFTMKEAAWLVEHAGLRVEISPKVLGTFEAYAKVWAATQAEATPDPSAYLVVKDRLGKVVFAGRGAVVSTEAGPPAPRAAFVAPQDIAAGSLRAEDSLGGA